MLSDHEVMTANQFHEGQCFQETGPRGGVRVHQIIWRRNGKTQTWKTRPGEFRIPVKFGMYGYSNITHHDSDRFHTSENCPLNHDNA